MAKEVDAITRLYDYILWVIPKIDAFPRNRKFTLGDRIENLLLDILYLLIEAAYSKNKSDLLRCRCYIRYVDDFVVFDNDKMQLHDLKAQMSAYLESLRLKLHRNKCRVYRVTDGVAFLGYRVFPTHRLLKKENSLKMRRRLKKMCIQYRTGEISLDKVNQRIQSWIGHAGHADIWHLRQRLFSEAVFQRGDAKSAARGFVEQQPEQRALRQPQQKPPEQPEQQCWFSLLQDF